MDEVIEEFLVESHENLDQLDRDFVALEQNPTSRELLSSIFRTIHTIKGTSGFLAFGHLEQLTHAGESLLAKLRDGELRLDPERTSTLLRMVDAVRAMLAAVEQTGSDEAGAADCPALIARLNELQTESAVPARGVPAQRDADDEEPVAVSATASSDAAPAKPARRRSPKPAAKAAKPAAPTPPPPPPVEAPATPAPTVDAPVAEAAAEPDVAAAEPPADAGDARRSVADSTIRVDVDLLDTLMRLVGELVLTRNQIVQQAATTRDANLVRASQRLNLIASELQEGVMKTRMQPIDNVWNKLPRVVRDLGVACGKKVRLERVGGDTELDKTLLEAIKDPLTHLVRNAIDHGIESPDARAAKGKNPEGALTLRAFHESGQVNIQISDDGAGIDPAKIAAKGLQRGLVSPDQLTVMSEREIVDLIFRPGFSTAEKVTNVSGRGVGMDVVRTNIEKIGGTVDVRSEPGSGTTFHVKIPLTLAIIPALTVRCAGDRYAIPQVNLVELVRLEGDRARRGIEMISSTPVHRLRGNLLPLVFLDAQLGVSGERDDDTVSIVVLQAEERQFGLVVDDVLDTEEIVVKPLGSQLKGIGAYAGATILGDGRVALILDIPALAKQAHVLNSTSKRRASERSLGVGDVSEASSLLIAAVGENRRIAIPLSMVTRLEEFPTSVVEQVGTRDVVQYRGQILPLIRLARLLGDLERPGDLLQVVVYSQGRRSVGLVVDRILDISAEVLSAVSDLDDVGLTGSAVVQNKITEMLDVQAAILAADPHFFDSSHSEEVTR